jgi:carboxypeptidase C (cathepsin A)
MDKLNGRQPMAVKGCDRLVVNVVKNQNKKFVDIPPDYSSHLLPAIHNRIDGKDMCLNIYDVRLKDTSPACGMNWPPDIKPITDYLRVRSFSTAY